MVEFIQLRFFTTRKKSSWKCFDITILGVTSIANMVTEIKPY